MVGWGKTLERCGWLGMKGLLLLGVWLEEGLEDTFLSHFFGRVMEYSVYHLARHVAGKLLLILPRMTFHVINSDCTPWKFVWIF